MLSDYEGSVGRPLCTFENGSDKDGGGCSSMVEPVR